MIRKASALLNPTLLKSVSPNIMEQATAPNKVKTVPTFPNNLVEIMLKTPHCLPDSVKAVF